MRRLRCILLSLLWLTVLWQPAHSRSFPATPDATEAAQAWWGTTLQGSIADGCWHGPSASTTVSVATCRGFALHRDAVPTLKGFEETTPRSLTYSAGDGTYWLAGRSSPGLAVADWTCLPGTHYCFRQSSTPPIVPSGLLLLLESTVSGGAVTRTVIRAPWRRTTPALVPAGVTLTFGVCPQVGRWPLFRAGGAAVGEGLVRFEPDACASVWPEWWGADPTGRQDSTAAWNSVVQAVQNLPTSTPERTGIQVIACEGVYAISSSGTEDAIRLENGVGIVGPVLHMGGGSPRTPCRFLYSGTGAAIGASDLGGTTHNAMRLENLQIIDVQDTGGWGLRLYGLNGSFIQRVVVEGFDIGGYFGAYIFYGDISHLRFLSPRTRCGHFIGGINGQRVQAHCHAGTRTTLTHGFLVGYGATLGTGTSSNNPHLVFQVEVNSGVAVGLQRIHGLDAQLYVETRGDPADYGTQGVVTLSGIEGGRVHLSAEGFIAPPNQINTGLRIIPEAEPAPLPLHTKNVRFTGALRGFKFAIIAEPEPGGWGLDFSGVRIDVAQETVDGEYTEGFLLGKSYITAGANLPAVDEGRGSTAQGGQWELGDLIWYTPSAGLARISNLLRQVHVAGNPPEAVWLLVPTQSELVAPGDVATPTIRQGNTYFTRLEVQGGSADITDLVDAVGGPCVLLRASGTRTLVNNSAAIRLQGGTNWTMNAGDMLHLCRSVGVWWEAGRSDNSP